MNLNEIFYGDAKNEYGVIENNDGTLVINVYHKNNSVRDEIKDKRDTPEYFLKYLQFTNTNPRAKFHLAKILRGNSSKFKNGEVEFILK